MEKERHQPPATPEEIWAILHEITKKQDRMAAEYEQRQKQAAKERKEDKKCINKLDELFTTQWSKLIESLVEGDLHRLLNEWGIAVHDTAERRKGKLDKPLTE